MDRQSLEAMARSLDEMWRSYRRDASDQMGPYLDAICEAMQECGIGRAKITYQGSGDEGWVQEPEFEPKELEVPRELSELVFAFVGVNLPSGWELEGGSSGTVILDPTEVPRARFSHAYNLDEPDGSSFDVAGHADPGLAELCSELAAQGIDEATFDYYADAGDRVSVWIGSQPGGRELSAALRTRLDEWVATTLAGRPDADQRRQGDGRILAREQRASFAHSVIHRQTEDAPFAID